MVTMHCPLCGQKVARASFTAGRLGILSQGRPSTMRLGCGHAFTGDLARGLRDLALADPRLAWRIWE
jgi:hypothetical protein